MKVLVADDEAVIRRLVRDSVGFDRPDALVLEARDAVEAIDIARRERPDIVIMDCVMPGMTGADAVPLIRDAVPQARIVLFSALDDGRLAAAAEAAGVEFFPKTDVLEMIELLLSADPVGR